MSTNKEQSPEIEYFFDAFDAGKQKRVIRPASNNQEIMIFARADPDCPSDVVNAIFSICEAIAENEITIEGWND